MVTVPLLVKPAEPWLDQCLASLTDCTVLQLPASDSMGEGRARGFTVAQTEYVAIVDPDDWVVPGMPLRCAQLLEDTGAVLAHTHEMRVDEEGNSLYKVVNSTDYRCHHLTVYRLSAVLPFVGELHKYGWRADWALKAWLYRQGGQFVCLDEVGYFYRQHPNQTRRTDPDKEGAAAMRVLAQELGYV
jgi:hypothetical protein